MVAHLRSYKEIVIHPRCVQIGAGAGLGILGEQVLELAARWLISFKLGGDSK